MQSQIPLTRDLVLIGGGHAHALALRMWGMKPVPGVRLTLINPGPTAPYSGMLPGHIAGHYDRDALDIDLVKLARFAGARLILGEARAIDPVARRVSIAGRGTVDYDVASIDVGIHATMPSIPGFGPFALGAKPLDTYAARWRDFVEQIEAGTVNPDIVVIGGGVAGSELSLAMAHRLRGVGAQPRITLLEAGAALSGFTRRGQRVMRRAMDDYGITFRTDAKVARVEVDGVIVDDGSKIRSALTIGAAGAFAHDWLAKAPLPTTEDGFVKVGATLQVEGHPDLFAVGDCAHFTPDPKPKAGVYAVRAAPVLAHNLRARLAGGDMRAFYPQKDFLKLVSLGRQSALAQKQGATLAGPLLWRWKNRIDQKFMDMFRHLPRMTEPRLPRDVALGVRDELGGEGQMLCAGCGSKVAPGVLSAALENLPQIARDDVLAGPGDDAAVLQLGSARQVLTTDHLRAFTEDPALFARIAAVHALGDVWAMGAQPQAALTSITLPRQSDLLQARVMAEIMEAAGDVMRAAGAEIVGGHSTQGAELVIGFTITGLLTRDPITVGGAKPGDALILTRPLGTGTLLAAEMRGLARGADVAEMLAAMARPQGEVAAALSRAHAMTDVTGFGLAGHLMAICRASGLSASLDLNAIPAYPGAAALAGKGVRSTIHASNRAAAMVEGDGDAARMALLHDPQTAGGFLAAVDPADVTQSLTLISQAGGEGVVIGELQSGPASIRVG